MIDLASTSPTLGRFVRELEAQAPRVRTRRQVDRSGASREDLEASWLGWATRIVDEHRSVIVFSELLGHLASLAAPYEALCAVQRLIGDELRHVRLCAEVASFFGPLDALEIELDGLGLPPSTDPPAARALAIVARELVVAEGESIAVLRAYRDAASEPACREALSILLADEARHYAAGRHLFDRLVACLDRDAIAPMLERLPAIMREDAIAIREAHRRGATDGPGRRYGVSIRAAEAPPSIAHLAA
ncbi:MAG: ferritin-like domain-containing protein [Myxococcota bacterium]|nr:ferritin-like domain-containing protein [Myxococcota bacterium]